MSLSRFSYTPETSARLIGNPEDRRTAGTLHGFWYAFGSHDGHTLWEAPDNVSTAEQVGYRPPGSSLSGPSTRGPASR
jgi:hypothetical protein